MTIMLDAISKAIALAGDQRNERQKKFDASLGEPIEFEPDLDNEGHGVGFFKGPNGVFSVRKYSNGYHPNSVVQFSDDFINRLVRIQAHEVNPGKNDDHGP